jgi:hypothetical protein
MSQKRTLSVGSLNPDLLNIVCTHLLYEEQLEFITVNQSIRASSKLFRYLRLKKKYSLKFYDDITFRNKCLSLIKDASTQFKLNFRGCHQLTDVSALDNVHTLDLSKCDQLTDVSALGHVHSLDLSECAQLTDVSALGHVHTLN